jgi:hypothetical protein
MVMMALVVHDDRASGRGGPGDLWRGGAVQAAAGTGGEAGRQREHHQALHGSFASSAGGCR